VTKADIYQFMSRTFSDAYLRIREAWRCNDCCCSPWDTRSLTGNL